MARMLYVWSISGKELASMAMEELTTVEALKQHLRLLHSIPLCIPVQLLHDGEPMDDAVVLDSPMDVQMVLLPISSTEMKQVARELSECAAQGHSEVLRWLLQAGADKDTTVIGKTALLEQPAQDRLR